jgi:signal transduction histidine kinase
MKEENMKTLQHSSAYLRKRDSRLSAADVSAFPCLNTNAVQRGTELLSFREPPCLIFPIILQATQNIKQKLYELLGTAELMRVEYEKGELASVQNRLALLMMDATNLASCISSVLELKQLEKAPVEVVCKHFDIVALLHEVSDAARLMVGEKPITVMDASFPSPVVIFSDSSMIRQIMLGLMNNAARFTARGRIALILSKDEDKIRLTVADTGKGMASEQIQAVFESADYKQDDEMNGIAASGTGLRIVKALVQKLDGKISIASKPGEGTIVEVSLPLRVPL